MTINKLSRRTLVNAAALFGLGAQFATTRAWAAKGGTKGKPKPPPPPPPGIGNTWSPVYGWADVAIHLHLLSSGKLLSFSDEDHEGGTRADFCKAFIIDMPINSAPSQTYVEVHNTTTNMFCSGHAFLPDGRLFVLGGHESGNGHGSTDTNILEGNVWKLQGSNPMSAGRWYPAALAMGDGSVLALGGSIDHSFRMNDLPEVWQWPSGGWRPLSNARRVVEMYARLHLAPNGRAFMCGPQQDTHYLDVVGTGRWDFVANRTFGHRGEGCSVMYEPGKVLIIGGGDPPTATAETIDLNAASPAWLATGSMKYPRRHHNATLLPDGKVLVTGGTSSGGFNDATGAALAAELWDPATGTWTELARGQIPRCYHSTALLLPDGRVVSGGGGRPAPTNGVNNKNIEIFSPPYLNYTRPVVTDVSPTNVPYGQTIVVTTPSAATVAKVTLVSLSSVSHGDNMSQRFSQLTYAQTNGGIFANAPVDRNLAPPGVYMLFLISTEGAPSLARMIKLG